MKQKTKEWHKARLGKFTASTIHNILGRGRKKDEEFSQKCLTQINEKIAEKLTGQTKTFTNTAMEWGIQHEDEARKKYEEKTGNKVKQVGFIQHNENSGGSPDGVMKEGIIEIKCPYASENQVNMYVTNEIPPEYYSQIQMNLLVTNKEWCDYVSYDPRFKKHGQLYIKRIPRDEEHIELIKKRIELCTKKMEEIIKKIKC